MLQPATRFSVGMPGMDEKRPAYPTYMLHAPGAASPALRLPGREPLPGVDDHLVEAEVTREEMIGGRRVIALPALPPPRRPSLRAGLRSGSSHRLGLPRLDGSALWGGAAGDLALQRPRSTGQVVGSGHRSLLRRRGHLEALKAAVPAGQRRPPARPDLRSGPPALRAWRSMAPMTPGGFTNQEHAGAESAAGRGSPGGPRTLRAARSHAGSSAPTALRRRCRRS